MLEELMKNVNLSEIEKSILNYVIDPLNDINNITSTQLGKACYTSQSTVIRLYKKLGFKSYREFISVVASSRNKIMSSIDIVDQVSKNASDLSYDDVVNILQLMIEQTLQATNRILDENIVKRVCNRICNAQNVDVYCVGHLYELSLHFVNQLQSIGINATFHARLNEKYLEANNHITNKIAIVISSDISDEGKELVQLLKNYKYYTVSIAPKHDDGMLTQDKLEYFTNQNNYTDGLQSHYSILYVTDLIISLIEMKRKERI